MIRYLATLCFALSISLSYAQDFHLKSYYERTQINSGFVYDILQDNIGYITVLSGDGVHQLQGGIWDKLVDLNELNNTYPSAATALKSGLLIGNSYGELFLYEKGEINQIKSPIKNKITDIVSFDERFFVRDINNNLLILNKEYDYETLLNDNVLSIGISNNELLILREDAISKWDSKSAVFIPFLQNELKINNCLFTQSGKVLMSNSKRMYLAESSTLKIYDSLKLDFNIIKSWTLGSKVYFGYNGQVVIYEHNNNKLNYYGKIGRQSGLNGGEINSLYEDTEGQLWLGTNEQGLFSLPKLHYAEFKALPTKIKSLYKDGEDIYALSNNKVYQLKLTGEVEIEFIEYFNGNTNYQAFIVQDGSIFLADKQFIYVKNKDKINKIALPTSDLRINKLQLFGDRLYISTITHGVYLYNLEDPSGTWINWDTKTGLSHNDIAMVYEFPNTSDTWIFTNGAGLVKYDGNSFEYFGYSTGLRSFDVNDIAVIGENLWIASSGEGVYRINTKSDSLSFLQESFPESPVHAYSLDQREGKLSILAVEDLVIYDQAKSKLFKQSHDVNFIGGTHYHVDDDGFLILANERLFLSKLNFTDRIVDDRIHLKNIKVNGEQIPVKKNFTLPYKKYNIEFNIQAISPFYGKDLLYQYKLDNYDESWSKPSPLSYIIYKKLPDGKYKLRIRPVLNGKAFKETSLRFEILTPYWKKWWFIISSAILVILLTYFIATMRIRRIKNLAKRLSKMVDIRTSQLNKQNEQLKEYTYAISHDLKNPVLNIEGLSNILVDESIPEEEKQQIHIMLKETSGQLHQNLLGLIEVLKSGGQTSIETVSLNAIMREIEVENNSAFLNKDVEVKYDIKQESILFNKENLKSVLANLISNAIKYSHPDRKPEISLISYQKGGYNYLEIEDNGLGIDMEKDGDKLFGMFRRIHTNAEGSGVGMYMVNTIIQKAGGEIDVVSQLGVGTKFIIKIPVKPETLD